MKKLNAGLAILVAVAGAEMSSRAANACDRNGRVVYAQPLKVVYSTPAVHAVSQVPAAPVVRTTTVTSSSVVTKLSVAPIAVKQEMPMPAEPLPAIEPRSVVRAKVRFAGNAAGEVTLLAGKLEMQCEVLEWSAGLVAFRLPEVDIVDDSEVTLKIFTSNGVMVRTVKANLTSSPDLQIEPPTATLVQNPAPAPIIN